MAGFSHTKRVNEMASEEDNKLVGDFALRQIKFQAKICKIVSWALIVMGIPLCLVGIGFAFVGIGVFGLYWSRRLVKTAEARIADGSAMKLMGAVGRVVTGQ